jgi:lipid-A-disaccharide synthase
VRQSTKHKALSTTIAAIIPTVPERFNLMLVAGEPSGDAHAAALVEALHDSSPATEFEFFGATGPQMRAAGVETVVNSDDLAIMGILEVTRVLPKFVSAFNKLKHAAIARQPDAVVLIDWPEFNLRLARSLHRRGLKIIYYISPQLWAWRPRRVRNVVRDVDLLLSILPFESEWYAARGVKHVSFVGHPLSGEVVARLTREEFCRQHDLDPRRPILAFLPGSRSKELQRILPPMIEAIEEIRSRQREECNFQFVIAVARSRTVEEARSVISQHSSHFNFESVSLVRGQTREVLAVSQAAAVASGTATLEAALLETPMVIVYKESSINWHTLGRLITAEHYGLVNLVAGQRLATELMQDDLTGKKLATELLVLLEPERNKEMRKRLGDVAHRLGEPGASKRAAQEVIAELRSTDCADYTDKRSKPIKI